MILLDTNILIYMALDNRDFDSLREKISTRDEYCTSVICKLEALGYPDIQEQEEVTIEGILSSLSQEPITDEIIDRAIRYRKQKKMTVGDAIVAATAVEKGCELWTNNTEDFRHIDALTLYNPLVA